MSFFNTTETAFGLDISNGCLRLIQLEKRRQKIGVRFYNEIKLPNDCVKGGEISQPHALVDALSQLIKTRHGRSGRLSDEVISVLPEEKTFLKTIELPLTEDRGIDEQIRQVLPQHVPISMDDIYFDWQIIKKNESGQTVLVGASPKHLIDSYVKMFNQASLIPTALEIEAAAIARVLVECNQGPQPQVVIDIGANRTGLFLYDENTVKFTVSLPISGNQTTQLIVDTLGLDFEQAERAKVVCGLDAQKCHGALLEIFAETIAALGRGIHQAIDFYYDSFAGAQKVKKITLCGGGANFLDIAKIIESQLAIPTAVSNPWEKIKNPQPSFFTAQKSQSFVTALGLALRGLNPETFL